MRDPVFDAFLWSQLESGVALAAESDLLTLLPLPEDLAQAMNVGGPPPETLDVSVPPSRYIADFRCKGLVRTVGGDIEEAERFGIGIAFPPDYLMTANTFAVLTLLGPPNTYHPNVSDRGPFVCIGHLAPGTPLVDILYQLFEVLTWNKVNMFEPNALNRDACAWARRNLDRFPVDRRPLKRRLIDVVVEEQETRA